MTQLGVTSKCDWLLIQRCAQNNLEKTQIEAQISKAPVKSC